MSNQAHCKKPYMSFSTEQQLNQLPEIKALDNQRFLLMQKNKLQHLTEKHKQWGQARKLLAGFESREEPDATEYYEKMCDIIEETHNATYLRCVMDHFDKLQIKPVEAYAEFDAVLAELAKAEAAEAEKVKAAEVEAQQ